MKKPQKIYTIALLVCVLIISGCEDCPNCPKPEAARGDYNVYFTGYNNNMQIYNTKKMSIIDSILLADLNSILDFQTIGKNQYLIIASDHDPIGEGNSSSSNITIYNTNTFEIIEKYPVRAYEIEISNTEKYIAVSCRDSLIFLNGTTFQILFTDTGYVHGGRFLQDDSKFYIIHQYKRIRIYDMASQSLDTIIEYRDNDGFSPSLYIAQPTANGEKIFLSSAYSSYVGYVLVYIPQLDLTTLHYPYTRGTSDLRLTPDGRQVVFTDPGALSMDQPGSGNVIFINPLNDAIISIVPPTQWVTGKLPVWPGEIALTPDGKYTITASCGLPVFGMIDNDQHKYVDVHNYDIGEKSFLHVSCQKVK